MPIYEFECGQCGHRFDRLQKLSDPDPEYCPSCSASRVQRRVSAPTFRLAGGGWYETDFKKDGEKKQHLAGDAGAGSDKSGDVAQQPDKAADPVKSATAESSKVAAKNDSASSSNP